MRSRWLLGHIAGWGIAVGLSGAVWALDPDPQGDPLALWLSSPAAGDWDGDKDVDEDDFRFWNETAYSALGDHPSLDQWLASIEAQDVNGDGKVDQADKSDQDRT